MVENPPAFPQPDRVVRNPAQGTGTVPGHPGMSLRDWFAGQALANPNICTGKAHDWQLQAWFGDRGGIMPEEIAAKQAGIWADAMLAERAKARGDHLNEGEG